MMEENITLFFLVGLFSKVKNVISCYADGRTLSSVVLLDDYLDY